MLVNQVAQPLVLIGELMVKDLAAECTLVVQRFALRRRRECLPVRTQGATRPKLVLEMDRLLVALSIVLVFEASAAVLTRCLLFAFMTPVAR